MATLPSDFSLDEWGVKHNPRTLKDARSLDDLAAMAGITAQLMGYILYKSPIDRRYSEFKIKKKSGGVRVISAPIKNLKLLQRSLARELSTLRRFKPCVKGFVPGESIKSNAQQHVNQKFVLNIDLEDFFGTINFGRVLGMLKKKPYEIDPYIAAVVAKAVTLQNKLPLGAPTSPIISNLLCAKLDSDLSRLAREHNCTYTRYADDITFSTHRNSFSLARKDETGGISNIILAPALIDAIESNGFKLNATKTRLFTKRDRQEVTGLIVNERVNVKRSFIRNTRAMLNSWAKYGLEEADREFKEKFGGATPFQQMLQGRIAFIGQIRGRSDSVFKKLSAEYNSRAKASGIRSRISTVLTPREVCTQSTWVIEGDSSAQGTAVFVEGIGLVTCYHCLSKENYIYHRDHPGKRFSVEVIRADKHIDLAILKAPIPLLGVPLRTSPLQPHESIYLVGYPNHSAGRPLRNEPGTLISEFPRSAVRMLEISSKVIEGNSGGPVLDSEYRLIGIAKAGINSKTPVDRAEFLAISAVELKSLIE